MTAQEITHYSELMAEFEGYKLCDCGNNPPHYRMGKLNYQVVDVVNLKYHTSYDWLHRVWVKFRDLKFTYSPDFFEVIKHHETLCDQTINTVMRRPHEEAFLKLGKAIEWYEQINQPGKH